MPDPKHVDVPEEAVEAAGAISHPTGLTEFARQRIRGELKAAAPIIASKAVDRTIGELRQERGKLEARIERLERELEETCSALRAIRGPEDSGPWIIVYREAGGGYEGLQAIAEVALKRGAAELRGGSDV